MDSTEAVSDTTTNSKNSFFSTLLHSPYIGPLSLLIALIALLFTPLPDRLFKNLEITILSNTALVQINDSIEEDINISYKDEEIGNIWIVQLRLRHTGYPLINSEYTRDEFESEIILDFGDEVEIVDYSVIEESENMQFNIRSDDNKGIIEKQLIKVGESAIFRYILIGNSSNYTVPTTTSSRLVAGDLNVVNIQDSQASPSTSSAILSIMLVAMMTQLLLVKLASYIGNRQRKDLEQIVDREIKKRERAIRNRRL